MVLLNHSIDEDWMHDAWEKEKKKDFKALKSTWSWATHEIGIQEHSNYIQIAINISIYMTESKIRKAATSANEWTGLDVLGRRLPMDKRQYKYNSDYNLNACRCSEVVLDTQCKPKFRNLWLKTKTDNNKKHCDDKKWQNKFSIKYITPFR